MYYILFTEDINRNDVIEVLKELGFSNSGYGVEINKAEGICSYYNPRENIKSYTLLAGDMLSVNPCTSWILNRKQAYTIEEFKDMIIEGIKLWNTKE